MQNSTSGRNSLDRIAEEFTLRVRRGEQPGLAEYAEKYPEHADEIRRILPGILAMEKFKAPIDQSGGAAGESAALGHRGVPARLGDYRIVREIGRGGMGVVYEAEQESLGRRVALMVLPAHVRSEPVRLARFLREARAAARLHHSNIVPVFDVGECDEVHYYATQFIEGQALDDEFDELKRLRASVPLGRGSRSIGIDRAADGPDRHTGAKQTIATCLQAGWLGFEHDVAGETTEGDLAPVTSDSLVPEQADPVGEAKAASSGNSALDGSALSRPSDHRYFTAIARIGFHAAEALAHAHSHRVLHRDVKPGNLILDYSGTVWLTDFGLAKEDGDELTRTGELVGTLRYVAPERFNGQADLPSDLYGLGLTLYELATLRPAFTGSDRHRLIRQIMHDEPAAPRAIDRRVPRDLETIIVKAIAKEPHPRYASASDLAQDLGLFLNDRPILARRVTWTEQALKWCRRNPLTATLSSLVVVMVLTMTILAYFSAWRLAREAAHARTAERDSLVRRYDARLAQAQVWDLRLIARSLNDLGLDSTFITFPPRNRS